MGLEVTGAVIDYLHSSLLNSLTYHSERHLALLLVYAQNRGDSGLACFVSNEHGSVRTPMWGWSWCQEDFATRERVFSLSSEVAGKQTGSLMICGASQHQCILLRVYEQCWAESFIKGGIEESLKLVFYPFMRTSVLELSDHTRAPLFEICLPVTRYDPPIYHHRYI